MRAMILGVLVIPSSVRVSVDCGLVEESKVAKNRIHVDLDCPDLDAERTRLLGLGAEFVHEKHEFGLRWMTFRDPEGNEFCAAQHG